MHSDGESLVQSHTAGWGYSVHYSLAFCAFKG